MKLSAAEFELIRPVQWSLIPYANKSYYSVNNELDRRLFWNDFMKFVFAPKFAKQNIINVINEFDNTQSVLFDPDTGEIKLPPSLEVVNHATKIKSFEPLQFPITTQFVLVIAIIVYLILGVYLMYAKKYTNNLTI